MTAAKLSGSDDPSLRIDAGLDPGDVDHVNLKAALVDDVQIAPVAGKHHVAREGALEMQLRRRHHIERPIERVRGAVEVDRSDDPPGNGVGDPDVAVLAA